MMFFLQLVLQIFYNLHFQEWLLFNVNKWDKFYKKSVKTIVTQIYHDTYLGTLLVIAGMP